MFLETYSAIVPWELMFSALLNPMAPMVAVKSHSTFVFLLFGGQWKISVRKIEHIAKENTFRATWEGLGAGMTLGLAVFREQHRISTSMEHSTELRQFEKHYSIPFAGTVLRLWM